MDLQGGENKNNQPSAVTPTAAEPNVEGVVAAAQEAAAAQTPKRQFENQFGWGIVSPVTKAPVVPLDPGINIVLDPFAKEPQVVEAVAPAEQTPAEKLKKQIEDSVNTFLEEVTKEKAAV